MGIHCSSELHRGQIKSTINMQAFLILPSILVLSVLTVNEVHGWYGGYYGYPYYPAAAYVPLTVEPRNPTAYGYSAGAQLVVAKPKVVKRDAEADPQLLLAHPHFYGYPYVPLTTVEPRNPTAYGYSAGAKVVVAEPKVVKRNAEADPQLFLPPYYPHVYTHPAHPAYAPVL